MGHNVWQVFTCYCFLRVGTLKMKYFLGPIETGRNRKLNFGFDRFSFILKNYNLVGSIYNQISQNLNFIFSINF